MRRFAAMASWSGPRVAAAVLDPEIPVLTLEDLGVLRGVERREGRIVVKLTPTYTGCPATLAIRLALEAALAQAGLAEATVETVLSPPWSTDDITEEGRRKLKTSVSLRPGGPAACARCSPMRPSLAPSAGRSTPQDLGVRLHALQGAVALRGLRGALRRLQVPLNPWADARFPNLEIVEVERETPEAISVTLRIPDALREAFRFKPGQHLTLRTTLEGEEQRRTYSICCGPGRRTCASPSSACPRDAFRVGPTTRCKRAPRWR